MCQLSVVLAPSANMKQSLKEAIYYESVAFTISSTFFKMQGLFKPSNIKSSMFEDFQLLYKPCKFKQDT